MVTAVEGEPGEGSCETLDRAPDFKAANDVRTRRTGEYSTVDSLRDSGDIALVDEFTELAADSDSGCAALGIVLEVVQVEVVLLDLDGDRGPEGVCGGLG